MAAILSQPPKYLRSRPERSAKGALQVDRRGGDSKAGIIRGVSVITKGEALGHDMWVDDVMLEQVTDLLNTGTKGLKSRFTHPSLSGDGMGRYVGRVKGAELRGDQVIADLHLATVSHTTPDGDLGEYLMTLAETDPEAYGLSIVFSQDREATRQFAREHEDQDGNFESPDPDNIHNYPHARVAELRAVDTVDEPAANPGGLFHRGDQIAVEADAFASYAVGISESLPGEVSLGIDPDRLRQFVGRFLDAHNLEITEKSMSDEAKPADDVVVETAEEQTAELSADNDTPEVGDTAAAPEPVEPAPVVEASSRDEAKRFRDAFGDRGFGWFCDGKSFEDASGLYVEELKAENEELRKQNSALSSGETEPVDFDAEERADVSKPRGRGLASRINIQSK